MVTQFTDPKRIREANPEVADIIDSFSELNEVYREALIAMGLTMGPSSEITVSTDTVITFSSDSTS